MRQAREDSDQIVQDPYLFEHPQGKSSTQPMILKVDNKLANQPFPASAAENHHVLHQQLSHQQAVERRRLIFQRQKVFNLSSREELGTQSHAGLKQRDDSSEQVSKFNQNPLIKSKSKETSVSSIERIP